MTYKIEIYGLAECKNNFKKLSNKIPMATAQRGVVASGPILEGQAKNYIDGRTIDEHQIKAFDEVGTTYMGTPSLHRRHAGGLAGRINHIVGEENGAPAVAVGTDSIYGRIHEMGGIIKPVKAKFLTFMIGDKLIRTKKVTMPSRPFLLPTLFKCQAMIQKLFSDIFWEELDKENEVK